MSMPKLRFSKFDTQWEKKTLGDIFTFKNGVNASKEQYGSGYKFINVLDIINNDFITFEKIIGAVNISASDFIKNEVRYGDILFQRSSETREEVGQSNVYVGHQSVTFGGFVIRGRGIAEYNPYFFNYVLKTDAIRDEITQRSGGSTRYNIGQESLSVVPVFIPTILEQTKIANFLTVVDEKVTQLTQKSDLLAQYKKGVMQQIFSQELRFKDDDGRDFPVWEVKYVGEVFNDFKGIGLSKDKIGISGKNKCILYGHLFTKYSEVITDISSRTDYDEGLLSEANDILMPSSTTTSGIDLAKASSLKESRVLLGGDIIVLRALESINSDYFAYYFTHAVNKEIAEVTQGITIIHLYFKELKKVQIKVPSVNEQTKIANFLAAIDDKINNAQAQLAAVKQYKQGLLQQMFV